jgi:speckle-type POZ protein
MMESELVGSTSLTRIPLHYKWVIHDAKVFLTNRDSLKSPEFPLRVKDFSSSWHLSIQKSKDNYVQHFGKPYGDSRQHQVPHSDPTYCFRLWQGGSQDAPHSQASKDFVYGGSYPKSLQHSVGFAGERMPHTSMPPQESSVNTVLISECVFAILHPKTNETLYSTTPPKQMPQCVVDASQKECCSVESIKRSDLIKHLFNDVLTLQVTATLLCIGRPVESDLQCKVPPDNLRKEIHDLYEDMMFTDVVIKSGKEEFKVHKIILASQSPVFRKMFEVDMKEKRSGVLTITDLSPAVVSDLVTFLYTGTAPNIRTLTTDLLNAAKKYELSRLHTMCENELKKRVCVANVVEMISLADLYEALSLKRECLKFIRLNLNSVKKTRQWEDLKERSGALLKEIFEHCFDRGNNFNTGHRY